MTMSSAATQTQRTVLRKAPGAGQPPGGGAAAGGGPKGAATEAEEPALAFGSLQGDSSAEPYCLLDAATWQVQPQAAAELLSPTNAAFTVVGALGPQGLGKSSFLNRLLGLAGALPAAGPHPSPAFPTTAAAAVRHGTRGLELRVGPGRIIALDAQPLFSASVLEGMIAGWDQPPVALAAPAMAAASEAKAAAVPFEGVQALAQLQLAVLLLSACNRLLIFARGLDDPRTYELLLTAEMLARGVPDPSLPPAQQPPPAAAGPGGGGGQAGAVAAAPLRAPPPQEHLAEVVLVHVLPAGARPPSLAQLQQLEERLEATFAGSRLRRTGALRMRDALQQAGSGGGGSGEAMSYWVLPALPAACPATADGPAGAAASGPEEQAWGALVAALLERPAPPFARRCSEHGWLRGVAGDTWRAVRKSADIAAFYSRLARTQLKGAGGWGLAR